MKTNTQLAVNSGAIYAVMIANSFLSTGMPATIKFIKLMQSAANSCCRREMFKQSALINKRLYEVIINNGVVYER